ncbi:LOW QUALITY PROTEIN: protein phosphatase 1 regulatory subunit 3C-B [Sphaeramia orbicularis]|uniref:LOW QUALITY PROTEIN: protein phosphatase 1 regulatory subunit 3C-B n=1 Tax=Sphaeramia orbicularis TaxID=375764 RepID=UPI00117D8DAB|nr:LOW QUALITY PROTEIN: protein phosphatase 1 regulatory subunit 3C-B-like [Sphaeramia orbicularis]
MNCTRVLPALGGHPQPPMMPVDLAMCLSLSQREPLYQLLSMSPLRPTQPLCQSTDYPQKTAVYSPYYSSTSSSSSSSLLPSSPSPSVLRSCIQRESSAGSKKRVVFADAKDCRLLLYDFSPLNPHPRLPRSMKPSGVKLQSQQLTSQKLQHYKLRLGFQQPTLDFNALLARLRDMRVQLESCSLSENHLSGKVRVSHASYEQSVHVRMTFDSWRNHHDIPCTFLQQQRCGVFNMDIFSFDFSLPQNLDPRDRIEFCVCFRPEPGATLHWDNNKGQNYRVLMEKDELKGNQGDAIHGCPTLSKYRPPSWPSHLASLGLHTSAEYLKRSLSNRVGAEWRTLCSVK